MQYDVKSVDANTVYFWQQGTLAVAAVLIVALAIKWCGVLPFMHIT